MNGLEGVILLTKAGGILGPIADILGFIMDLLFRFTSSFGILNIGLCIILFTIVTKVLMFPLTVKQQKSSKLMAVMQPEISAIQKKYKGKSDQQSMMLMQAETKAVYEKYGTSMTGGCLPLLIQMPILFALYRVIYNIPAYVESVRIYFDKVIAALPGGYQSSPVFTELAKAQNLPVDKIDYSNMDKVIDLLYKFTDQQWADLSAAFPSVANVLTDAGENVIRSIEHMQQFFGLNITYTPFQVIINFFNGSGKASALMMITALAIPLLAGFSQWFSAKLMTAQNQSANSDDNPAAGMMKQMNIMMPLMSVVFCFTFASGIGIYWIAQSVFTIIQQLIINSYLNKEDLDELIKKNVEKANKKRAKKGLPPAKVNTHATATVKQAQEKAEKEESSRMEKIAKTQARVKESTSYYNENAKPGSLASKADMVRKYNEKHEKK